MDNLRTRGVYEGVYGDGKKVGEWMVYDKTGALKQCKVFKAKK